MENGLPAVSGKGEAANVCCVLLRQGQALTRRLLILCLTEVLKLFWYFIHEEAVDQRNWNAQPEASWIYDELLTG